MTKTTGSKRQRLSRDWVTGSVTGNLIALSWPIMVHNALYMVGQTVDIIWIGRLGSAAVAGVGTAFIIHMLVLSAKMGLVTGARAMVARAMGSGDFPRANHLGTQAFVVSILYGVFFSILGLVFPSQIMGIFGLKPEVAALGAEYMRVLFGGWIFYSLWLMAFSLMQSSGDTTTPMYIHFATRSVQLILSPFLVFGWWVFPKLGVQGAALAMITGQFLGMIIALWILFLGQNSKLKLTLKGFRLDFASIKQMVKIGLPALFMGVQGNLGQTVLMKIIVPFGTLAVAAHTLNQRAEMFVQMPGVGLGTGAGVSGGAKPGGKPVEARGTNRMDGHDHTGGFYGSLRRSRSCRRSGSYAPFHRRTRTDTNRERFPSHRRCRLSDERVYHLPAEFHFRERGHHAAHGHQHLSNLDNLAPCRLPSPPLH